MTPNLYVAAQKLFRPHRWFSSDNRDRSRSRSRTTNEHEYRKYPIPGMYEYRPGRGWYLTAMDNSAKTLDKPILIKYSRVLRRSLLQPDYDTRKTHGKIKNADGSLADHEVGFFRLDDGIAWVNYLDKEGNFIPGPYKLWCVDGKSGYFRQMLKGDSPAWQSRCSSRRGSQSSNPSEHSRVKSPSQRPSSERATELHGLPAASSRPRSFEGTSKSQLGSRQGSFLDGTASQVSTRPSSMRHQFGSVCGSESTAPTSPSNSLMSDEALQELSNSCRLILY